MSEEITAPRSTLAAEPAAGDERPLTLMPERVPEEIVARAKAAFAQRSAVAGETNRPRSSSPTDGLAS